MALAKQFSKRLEDLWKRRTAMLRSLVIPRRVGPPKKFTRQARDKLVSQLLDEATELLLNRKGRLEFHRVAPNRRLWQIKGHGYMNRGSNLLEWASKLRGPIVYVFWKRQNCLYVGKGTTWKRLRGYQKSAYLLQATSIEVFFIVNKSQLGKAECLATHLFNPRDKRKKPSKEKWGKECPICKKHDIIRDDLNDLFKMR